MVSRRVSTHTALKNSSGDVNLIAAARQIEALECLSWRGADGGRGVAIRKAHADGV